MTHDSFRDRENLLLFINAREFPLAWSIPKRLLLFFFHLHFVFGLLGLGLVLLFHFLLRRPAFLVLHFSLVLFHPALFLHHSSFLLFHHSTLFGGEAPQRHHEYTCS